MKELITRIEELAVQASRDARQIETLQGLLRASQSSLEDELQDAIESKKKINELASENARLIVSECGHKKTAVEVSEQYADYKENAERWKKALNEAITKRDIELRAVDVAKRAHEKELAEQREEIRKLRAEVPLESTREGLKNAVAKLQEVTTEKDRMRLQLENARADLKQVLVERDSLGAMAADRAQEIRKLMDGHAEDMKAQAELQSKYESILTKTTDLGSYAMTIGRKEGEPLEMFMERQALRLAALESEAGPSIETLSAELSVRYAEIAELHNWALVMIESPAFARYHYERVQEYNAIVGRINSRPQLDLTATLPTVDWQVVARNLEQTIAGLNAKVAELEAQGAYATKVASQLGERIAYVQKQSMALETLVMRIKSYRNTEAVQQCALIHQLIDATLETMGTRLTA